MADESNTEADQNSLRRERDKVQAEIDELDAAQGDELARLVEEALAAVNRATTEERCRGRLDRTAYAVDHLRYVAEDLSVRVCFATERSGGVTTLGYVATLGTKSGSGDTAAQAVANLRDNAKRGA